MNGEFRISLRASAVKNFCAFNTSMNASCGMFTVPKAFNPTAIPV